MLLTVPKELHPGENRVPITPDTAKKLVRLGATLHIESGMGVYHMDFRCVGLSMWVCDT